MRASIGLCGLLYVTACGQTESHGAADSQTDAHVASVMHDAASPSLRDAGSKHDAGKLDASQSAHSDAAIRDATVPKDTGVSMMDANVKGKDAGAAGADSGTAGAAAPSGACPGVFCEDFESGTLNTAVWTHTELTMPNNSVKVQSTQKAHGKYAAQFHAKGGTSLAMIEMENLPASLQQHYFGRLYYYASGFPTESGGHTAYVTSANTLKNFPDSDHHLEVASYYSDKGPIWQMTYWTGGAAEYIGSGGQIPTAQWFCLEWEFNDAPDAIGIWVDGDANTKGASFRNINNHATGLLGKMTTLGLGFRTWHPMGAPDVDIYIDDIVLDTKRVGCLQ